VAGRSDAWERAIRCRRKPFLERAEIGYDGLLSAEQCSPIIAQGHKLGTIQTVDERYVESLTFLKGLLRKIGAYTGHKADAPQA
jgi:hypothetical protein